MPTSASLRQRRPRGRLRPDPGARRRLRLLRSAHRDERALRAAADHGVRLGDPAHQRRAEYWRTIIRSGVIGVWIGILPGVGEDMAAWSSYATAKRLCEKPGGIRQGLGRRPDGGRDRRQRLGPRRHHSRARARDPGLRALRRAARRDDHPRRAARPDADGREPAIRLTRSSRWCCSRRSASCSSGCSSSSRC